MYPGFHHIFYVVEDDFELLVFLHPLSQVLGLQQENDCLKYSNQLSGTNSNECNITMSLPVLGKAISVSIRHKWNEIGISLLECLLCDILAWCLAGSVRTEQ